MTPAAAALVPRVEPSIVALTAGATAREQVHPADARSGSRFERVVLDGEPHFLKVLSYRTDWIMRVIDDRDLRTFRIWRAGLLSQVELQPLDSGTMVWHQRERHGLLVARIALASGDRAGAATAATQVCASAAARGSTRHELVARLLVACAGVIGHTDPGDHTGPAAVADLLTQLDRTSRMEAWRWTALAARHLGVNRWWALAQRQVDALAGAAGPHATTLRAFARRTLSDQG